LKVGTDDSVMIRLKLHGIPTQKRSRRLCQIAQSVLLL
jgi:hypothetical protein